MAQELVVGPDGTNAEEQLYELVGDDELFDILGDISMIDPDANVWADPRVQQRLRELGITMPEINQRADTDRNFDQQPQPA